MASQGVLKYIGQFGKWVAVFHKNFRFSFWCRHISENINLFLWFLEQIAYEKGQHKSPVQKALNIQYLWCVIDERGTPGSLSVL